MTNLERGNKLISQAEELLKEAKRAYQNSQYNIAVRRSQESEFWIHRNGGTCLKGTIDNTGNRISKET